MRDDFKVPKRPAPKRPVRKVAPARVMPEEPVETIEIDDEGQPEVKAVKRSDPKPTSHLDHLKAWWRSLNRNVRFGIIAAGLVIFCAVVLGIYYFTQPQANPSWEVIKHPKPAPAPTTVASPLTGVQVSPAEAARPVTGIMIENSTDARPQSGLQDAGVIYEAIAEGGITRFLTLYQEAQPSYIGPVRSLRPYYIDYAAPFQASIAHVGGSPDALNIIRNIKGLRDLDQFFNPGSYWRVASRAAPHNMYTNFDKLDALNKSKGYTHSSFTPWPRKPEPNKSQLNPTVTSIDLTLSGYDYNVHYDYDLKTNSYLRSEGGAPHMYLKSATAAPRQLHPKVVIALAVPLTNGALDSSNAYYSNYATSGSGQLFLFQNGRVYGGTWEKGGRTSQIQFLDSSGKPLELDAGQTWITLVSDPSQVSYK